MEKVKQELVKKGNRGQVVVANSYLIEFYEHEEQPEKALDYAMENEQLLIGEKNVISRYINTTLNSTRPHFPASI